MVAHYQSNTEENSIEHEDEVLTMVCHQTNIHYDMAEEKSMASRFLANEKVEPEVEKTFITSMVAHQMTAVDTPIELSELAVSMAAHVMDNGQKTYQLIRESLLKIASMKRMMTYTQ